MNMKILLRYFLSKYLILPVGHMYIIHADVLVILSRVYTILYFT